MDKQTSEVYTISMEKVEFWLKLTSHYALQFSKIFYQ